MQTKSLYLTDSYIKETNAEILAVEPEANGFRVMLSQTVFYPIGGGQPTDQGILKTPSGDLDVYLVQIKNGEIWHFIKGDTAPKVGDTVHAVINWDRRYKNMKVHTAGHIADFAMYLLGYSPQTLMPFKGDHGKKPFITYKGMINKDIRQELEDKANELVAKNLSLTTEFVPLEKLKKEAIYLQPGLPENKPLRILRLEGVGAVADGGTQTAKTGEVGKISITAIDTSEETTTVRYAIQ